MSSVLEAPAASASTDVVDARRATLALARVEGRKLVRHPIFLFGAALSVAIFAWVTYQQAPVLHADAVTVGGSLMALAGATFLVANLATLRGRRHETEELYGSTVTSPATRTVAHLLSVGWAVGAAAVLMALDFGYELAARPVGTPNVFELLSALAVVATAGALGVFLARWWPSPVVGSVGLVGLGALQYVLQVRASLRGSPASIRWLAPWVPLAPSSAPPPELLIRRPAWHLLYLAGIIAIAASLAVLRFARRIRTQGLLAAGLALAIVSASVQLAPIPPARQRSLAALILDSSGFQVCRTRARVQYCAYLAYVPWIDRWAPVVSGALRWAPPEARAGLHLRQTLWVGYDGDLPARAVDSLQHDVARDPTAIHPGPTWGRWNPGQYEFSLALAASTWAIGFPKSPNDIRLTERDIQLLAGQQGSEREQFLATTKPGDPYPQCMTLGQGRAVVALWLAAQATPGAGEYLRENDRLQPPDFQFIPSGTSGAGVSITGPEEFGLQDYPFAPPSAVSMLWGRDEVAYALQLLNRPAGDVGAAIRQNWKVLTDPRISTNQLVRLLGLQPLPTPEERLRRAGLNPDDYRQILAQMQPVEVPCR